MNRCRHDEERQDREGAHEAAAEIGDTGPEIGLLDVHEAAALLGLKSARTLYKWAYLGRIRSYKIGRNVRFSHADIERLKAEGERPAFASPDGFPLTAGSAAR